MAIPTHSRRDKAPSPPATVTPTHRRHHVSSLVSPSVSSSTYAPTIASNGHVPKLNIVTRVAIEGKATQGQDGASVKMYLKLSLPLDSVTPGSTIPLFSEEKVKILTSQVHPLDSHSVPYNFSSAISPLLHNAARALNLPARSRDAFQSVFGLQSTTSSSSRNSSDNLAPVDVQYTGHILVSGYHISYVLPRVFPQHSASQHLNDNEGEAVSRLSLRNRRSSMGDRSHIQFMAAIDMWVPYVSRPPRSPYLLSIPTPRCLHNNVKLRIFPPTNVTASFASLSSVEDDSGTWDLTSDPHVTRISKRPSRSNSYTHFADDESSDSSTTGFSDGCGIQGTFPSAERIRIRWAKPVKMVEVPGAVSDGRRRVGVKEAKGEMVCGIMGMLADRDHPDVRGVLMNIEYKGTCRGVWFPGVATLLGMDVGLEAKGCDISWPDGFPSQWQVGGGVGYTGYNVGETPRTMDPSSRSTSLDSTTPNDLAFPSSNVNAPHSTSSLMRAPLPLQHVAEYSFEGSAAAVASAIPSTADTLSSLSSSYQTNPMSSMLPPPPPGSPLTLHVNINELIHPAQNLFTFSISGIILVTPRSSLSRISPSDPDPRGLVWESSHHQEPTSLDMVTLPRFSVLAADDESTVTLVRNEVNDDAAVLELHTTVASGSGQSTRRTDLQQGGFMKCGEEVAKVLVRPGGNTSGQKSKPQTPGRTRTPSGSRPLAPGTPASLPTRARRGPAVIPSVAITVTPLASGDDSVPTDYVVRVRFHTQAPIDSEWVEFGLAHAPTDVASSAVDRSAPVDCSVEIASASVDGTPVDCETRNVADPRDGGYRGTPFEEVNGKNWLSWFKIRVGAVGGLVIVDYVVRSARPKWPVRRGKGALPLKVFLPTFLVPVGRFEVIIDYLTPFETVLVHSNLSQQQSTPSGFKLLRLSPEAFFYPELSFDLSPPSNNRASSIASWTLFLTWLFVIAGAMFLYRLDMRIHQLERSINASFVDVNSFWDSLPEPVTLTTTMYAEMGLCTQELHSVTITVYPTSSTSNPVPSSLENSASTDSVTMRTIAPPDLPHTPAATKSKTDLSISSPPRRSFSDLLVPYLPPTSWPALDVRTLHVSFDRIMRSLDSLWKMAQRAYHYPLNPS